MERSPSAWLAQRFVWYDLMTTDVPGAVRFYRDVIGWTVSDSGIPDSPPYTLFSASDGQIAAGGVGISQEATPAAHSPDGSGTSACRDLRSLGTRFNTGEARSIAAPRSSRASAVFPRAADPQGAVFILFEAKRGRGRCACDRRRRFHPDGTAAGAWRQLDRAVCRSAGSNFRHELDGQVNPR